jgi:hypothetical protein
MNWPNPLSGVGPEVQFLNRLLAKSRESEIVSKAGNGYRLRPSPSGTAMEIIYPSGGVGGVGISTKTVHFQQSLGDYFLTQEGIAVAKSFKIRCSIASETIYGTVINFTYPHSPAGGGPSGDSLAYLYRQAKIGASGTPENQGLVPQLLVGDPILIIQPTGGCGTASGVQLMSDPKDLVTSVGGIAVPITWMMMPDARAWTIFANPNF